MRFLLIWLFGLLLHPLRAELVYTDSTELLSIASGVLIYEDVAGSMTEAELLALPASAFERATREVPNFRRSDSHYWMRLDLRNATPQELYLIIDNALLQIADLYVEQADGSVHRTASGNLRPHATRYLQTSDLSFYLGRQPRRLLLRLATDTHFFVPAFVAAAPAVVAERHYLDLFHGAFLGIVLAMLFYHLFIFITTKDRTYLYYVLYIAAQAMMIVRMRGIGFDLLWPNVPALNGFPMFFAVLTLFFLTLFATRVLETKRYAPRLHRFLWLMAIVDVVALFGALVGLQVIAGTIVELISIVYALTLFGTSAYIAYKGNSAARYFLLAWTGTVIATIVLILALTGVLDITFWTLGAAQVGSGIRAILFSVALAAKLNDYKSEQMQAQEALVQQTLENERLVREHNATLEKKVERRTRQLREEKAKSDALLLNILPAPVAEELKRTGKATPRLHEQVSVMFIDIQEFTRYSEQVSPEELVDDIDRLFRGFDKIIKRHGVEKIKTIGDAYLCVAGLPAYHEDHALSLLNAARDIVAFVNEEQRKGKFFNIRVGLHCGPVVAGVVGESKFAYDIWGDTVNVAARMEQHSEEGRINVSQDFYRHVKERGQFEYRGKVAAKNKGAVDMYFVEGIAPSAN